MITSFNPQQSQMRQKQAFGTSISPRVMEFAERTLAQKGLKPQGLYFIREGLAKDGRNLRIDILSAYKQRLMLQQVRAKNGGLHVIKSSTLDHQKSPEPNKLASDILHDHILQTLLELTPQSIRKSAKSLSPKGPFANSVFTV